MLWGTTFLSEECLYGKKRHINSSPFKKQQISHAEQALNCLKFISQWNYHIKLKMSDLHLLQKMNWKNKKCLWLQNIMTKKNIMKFCMQHRF